MAFPQGCSEQTGPCGKWGPYSEVGFCIAASACEHPASHCPQVLGTSHIQRGPQTGTRGCSAPKREQVEIEKPRRTDSPAGVTQETCSTAQCLRLQTSLCDSQAMAGAPAQRRCPRVLPGIPGLSRVRGGMWDKPFSKKPEACKEGRSLSSNQLLQG